MSLGIFFLVLSAAALHAVWNALVKSAADKSVSMTAVVMGQGISGAICVMFLPMPVIEAWPYILGSVILHIGYQESLKAAYKVGDLTQVYPIARGVSPLLVAVFTVLVLGTKLHPIELAGVVLICCGIASLSITRRGAGERNGTATVLAILTGCFIAGYSILDGVGVRINRDAIGFFAWVALLNGLTYVAFAALRTPYVFMAVRRSWWIVVVGGGASFVAYAMVVYAFLYAPIALVTALRETSIVFALFIGVGVLKERLNLIKVFSTMLTLSGAALLRMGRS